MDTPVFDFVKKYNDSETVRLHVPGHKGRDEALMSYFDITEINGADVLYHETGILGESQKAASVVFGTKKTLYSTEGSSLCIRAMLALVKMFALKNGKKAVIAAGRNAHKVFMTAAALLDIEIEWIYPENRNCLVSADISPAYLDSFLEKCEDMPTAVYITSPDYLGNISDIGGLSEVCKKKGVLLLCDNAHGAYLRFLEKDRHPISLGAHMCCDSAHKTLPVLTGGAYLHISENAPEELCENAKKAMSLFASTSPSYLTLVSLDRFNGECAQKYKKEVADIANRLADLKSTLSCAGYICIGSEPLKLTLATKKYGYRSDVIAEFLRNNGFECEFSDPDYIVMMFTPEITEIEINKLETLLLSVERKESMECAVPTVAPLEKALSVKEALFMPSEDISVSDAVGRILAAPSVSCPPAVPVAICGEVLNEEAISCFMYYGIEKINVVIK